MSGPDDKDTNIHRPDGIFRGEKIGHANARAKFRERDGIFQGRELGYVDENHKVRKPDGVFRGEVVGKIKGLAAHGRDGIFQGEKWGYVDEDGNVRVRDGIFRGRIVGKVRGHNNEAALGFFIIQFTKLEERYNALAAEVRAAKNKAGFLGKVRHMLSYVPEANALGDFEGLIGRLRDLEREIASEQSRNHSQKDELCRRAESLSQSTDWKDAADHLKRLQEGWKAVGAVGRDQDDSLWARFRAAHDAFYSRRKAHFDRQDQDRERGRARKETLCARAESLSGSTDWKSAADALKSLQGEWKAAGPAGRDHDDALWDRFRRAQDRFFQRRGAAFENRNQEQRQNLSRKEDLCSEAESLVHSSDLRGATDRIKELQARWKAIGHVPREMADRLWDRFRSACDRVFERAKSEREHRQAEWSEKTRDALARKREQYDRIRESISHDESNIERWRETIYNLKPGGRAGEIQSDLMCRISDVADKISSKRSRLQDLSDAIRDMESKLYR